MTPAFDGPEPVVTLDPEHYRLMPDFERRFPAGPPSLRRASRLRVEGDVTFGANVVVEGDVHLAGPRHVPDGTVLHE
jgi:UTP--glucose-1-phosphate uridylyltransferase